MQRVTKRNSNGQYYMDGDGIFSDWGTPEKFMGDDVDTIGAIEDILGDDYDLERLRELVEADQLIGKELWLTKWWTPNVRLANAPIRRTVVYFSVCKNKSILLHLKDGALPLRLIGNCAYKTREAAEAALKGEQGG